MKIFFSIVEYISYITIYIFMKLGLESIGIDNDIICFLIILITILCRDLCLYVIEEFYEWGVKTWKK